MSLFAKGCGFTSIVCRKDNADIAGLLVLNDELFQCILDLWILEMSAVCENI